MRARVSLTLHGVHGCTDTLLGREHVSSSNVQTRVDTTLSSLWASNLDQEDGFLESRLGQQLGGVTDSSSGRDDLSSSSVDGIGVELTLAQLIVSTHSAVQNVVSDTSHGLLGETSLLGGPLESGNNGILDFVHVLHSLGSIEEDVGSSGIRTETPNSSSIGDIPTVRVGEVSSSELGVVSWSDLAVLNIRGQLLTQRLGPDVKPVVLVLRLRQGNHRRLGGDGLSVTDDGVGLSERNTGVVVFQIVQANLQVELTGTGNDNLSIVTDHGLDTRVRLGQSLETFDQFRQIGGVFTLDGDLDNGRDGKLHDLHVVGSLGSGQSTRLEQELIDTDKTDNVSGRAILDGLDGSTHHEDGSLNRLDDRVGLASGDKVGSLDSDLGSGSDGTREDSTESVESTLVGSGHHLGNVDHQRTLGVTVSDGNSRLVVHGTLVEGLDSVSLSGLGRRKVDDNHLEQDVSGGQELFHDTLEQRLSLEVSLVTDELDLELFKQSWNLVLFKVHDRVEDLENRVEDKQVESSLSSTVGRLGPLFGGTVEVVVTPKLGHELGLGDTKLLGVSTGELSERESPTVETGSKGDCSLFGVDLDVTKSGVGVGGDNDVDRLDGSAEGLVEILLFDLELEQSSVDLVDDKHGLDSLGQRLSQDGLGLDTDTFDTVDNDKRTIGDSESGGDLGREIDVTGRVDQVDQEFVSIGLLLDVLDILLGEGKVHGNGGRLDGDSSVNLVLPRC